MQRILSCVRNGWIVPEEEEEEVRMKVRVKDSLSLFVLMFLFQQAARVSTKVLLY